MDGDFAPMAELAKLRKKHGFLLVIDDVSILECSHVYLEFTILFGVCLVHVVLIQGQ